MMGKRALLLFGLVLSLVASLTPKVAKAQDEGAARTISSAQRKAYAGGRDESDLTVQMPKQIQKKEMDENPDDYEPEASEAGGDSDSGFGE